MSPKARQLRQWLRSQLDRLQDNTKGGESEFITLKHKLDDGALSWVGALPFGYNPPKRKRA